MSYVINLNDHQNIVIENFKITFFSYGVGPFIPINRNKHYVLKLNKKSVTTCNIEMLYEYLKNNETAARALFNVVSYANNVNDNFTKNILKTLLAKILMENGQTKHALEILEEQVAYFAKEKVATGVLLSWYLIGTSI